jgi:hypothetical protein
MLERQSPVLCQSNDIELLGTAFVVIAPWMSTSYNYITFDKINLTKITLAILPLPYVGNYIWVYEFRSVNKDTLSQ